MPKVPHLILTTLLILTVGPVEHLISRLLANEISSAGLEVLSWHLPEAPGAGNRTRTCMVLRPPAPQAGVSTIPPYPHMVDQMGFEPTTT